MSYGNFLNSLKTIPTLPSVWGGLITVMTEDPLTGEGQHEAASHVWGIKNPTTNDALVDMLGKPIGEWVREG